MYEEHTCPSCKKQVSILCDGRVLKDYEWCNDCKKEHQHKDWEVRWFNHRFQVFSRKDIYFRDGFRCYICNTYLVFGERNTTFDHELPTARGGLSTFSNLRLCCNRCNNKKGDLLLEELLDQYGSPEEWE